MAIKVGKNQYKCLFCDYIGPDPTNVDSHRDKEHDYLMIPMLREDLNRLIQFIFTKDDRLLTERLYTTLTSYNNNITRKLV